MWLLVGRIQGFEEKRLCRPERETRQNVRQCIEAPGFGRRDSIGGARCCSASSSGFLAAIAEGSHPIPSRTRKLSPPAPMVLQGRPCGRVGRCQIYGPEVLCGTSGPFFLGRIRANPSGTRPVFIGSKRPSVRAVPQTKQDSPSGGSRPAPTALNPQDSTTHPRSPDPPPASVPIRRSSGPTTRPAPEPRVRSPKQAVVPRPG